VHGDTPGAVEMARAVRTSLEEAGLALRPFVG
jgi:5-oxoprolinase (ATP-hydrolysing) subunit A